MFSPLKSINRVSQNLENQKVKVEKNKEQTLQFFEERLPHVNKYLENQIRNKVQRNLKISKEDKFVANYLVQNEMRIL